MEKLVRDKIPDIILGKGETVNYRIAKDDAEFWDFLKRKLLEEVDELFESNGDIGEFVDVLTVVKRMFQYKGISDNDIVAVAEDKAKWRGLFDKRIILITDDIPKNNT